LNLKSAGRILRPIMRSEVSDIAFFQHQLNEDCYASTVSPHVNKHRRNLAANTISVMRPVSMEAYQTVLLPRAATWRNQTVGLNHLELEQLENQKLQVDREIERAMAVAEPVMTKRACEFHPAGDLLVVFLNLRRWNEDGLAEDGRRLWGHENPRGLHPGLYDVAPVGTEIGRSFIISHSVAS
jgi:hypothetical protein